MWVEENAVMKERVVSKAEESGTIIEEGVMEEKVVDKTEERNQRILI